MLLRQADEGLAADGRHASGEIYHAGGRHRTPGDGSSRRTWWQLNTLPLTRTVE